MRTPETPTDRVLLQRQGQYAVSSLTQLDGLVPRFDVYELIIRGHTGLILGEVPVSEPEERTPIEPLGIQFDSVAAVRDIGVRILRASHIIIPGDGIELVEDVTDTQYVGGHSLDNPLNQTPPGFHESVSYPSGKS